MPEESEETKKRESLARAAIGKQVGTNPEYGVDLFISHHLEELDDAYWLEHAGTETPSPQQVFQALVLKGKWEDEDEGEFFDFTLPGEVTQYVICVRFDGDGNVDEVSMES